MQTIECKLRAGGYKFPARILIADESIRIHFGFSRPLIAEVKQFDGARWNPDQRCWTIKNSERNWFQLSYLMGNNPFALYDAPLVNFSTERPLRDHQILMVRHGLTRRHAIFAAEMGTGKSLAAIEIAETIQEGDIWYVGPVAGVRAFGREMIKWKCRSSIKMMTYDRLVSVVKNWPKGQPAPKCVIFDECSKLKTPTAQRSAAGLHLATSVRLDHPDEGMVILMSGTPAPKAPTDWWHQCEVACPGFLKEGNIHKFTRTLAIVEQRESLSGGVYPHHVAWRDDPNRCDLCGKFKEEHDVYCDHVFTPSVNEVARLHKRMKGLVLTLFKKDCLDLPEKQYRVIQIKPTPEILRLAKSIQQSCPRAVTALSLLRELSDGFQYKTIKTSDYVTCPVCNGTGMEQVPVRADADPNLGHLTPEGVDFVDAPCSRCEGTGEVLREERIADQVGTPKDNLLIELLDEHEDIGRIIVWGGFTGTLDRITKICHKHGWATLRVDGRGYKGLSATEEVLDANELLDAMDASSPRRAELAGAYPKIAFVGHPKAGGMALTLTASPTEVFYSNSFDGEARIQAEDRFHRIGMDENRGATIIDLIMLPSDLLVLNNLKNKKRLQSMTQGEMQDAWASAEQEMERWS